MNTAYLRNNEVERFEKGAINHVWSGPGPGGEIFDRSLSIYRIESGQSKNGGRFERVYLVELPD
jgi:hypothetical protein